jgi:hypothetical protein
MWTNIRTLSGIWTHGLNVQAIKASASDVAATGSGTGCAAVHKSNQKQADCRKTASPKLSRNTRIKVNLVARLLLTLLLTVREAQGSNIGPETSYPDLGFSWFLSYLQENAGVVP